MAGAAEVGSTKVTVTSCRWTTSNWAFISSSTASTKKKPKISSAMAKAMPMNESRVRTGLRPRLRRIMRAGSESSRVRPDRSSQPLVKLAGGSGRIASAGGSLTARRTAPSAPRAAATRLTARAMMAMRGDRRYWKSGKRKNWLYMAVIPRPSQAPTATPSTPPAKATTSATWCSGARPRGSSSPAP